MGSKSVIVRSAEAASASNSGGFRMERLANDHAIWVRLHGGNSPDASVGMAEDAVALKQGGWLTPSFATDHEVFASPCKSNFNSFMFAMAEAAREELSGPCQKIKCDKAQDIIIKFCGPKSESIAIADAEVDFSRFVKVCQCRDSPSRTRNILRYSLRYPRNRLRCYSLNQRLVEERQARHRPYSIRHLVYDHFGARAYGRRRDSMN